MRISGLLEAVGAAAFVAAGFMVGAEVGLAVTGVVAWLLALSVEAGERRKVEPPDDDPR